MNIELTSPDINEGYTGFSVSADHRIRYGPVSYTHLYPGREEDV